ncbi:MAG: tRNA (adenosine(37)-N6)-dimethylallyltransferase MiaA, partial [Prevotellaceae bacterium]|nr:tRNA (adenosine(37)-N6)-dimethylallyltransferase MiaA [Prevotellaceae bacterium]
MPTLIVLLGPTAVGKTELSVSIAKTLCCPILNCDSRQLFRELRIGTAAPTEEEMQGVRHYFVGTLSIDDYYSAARYEEEAIALLTELFKQLDKVILSGGSMLYIDAVCKGIDDIPTVDSRTRQLIKRRLATEGLSSLAEDLE